MIGPRFKIRRFGSLDSTNSEAIRLAKAGEPEGVVIVADTQTAGRGRLGRSWESPAGKNLHVSFLLRPLLTPQSALGITRMAAYAVVEALESFTSGGLHIKWPNDILLNDRKLCGILTEMGSIGDRAEWVVCGVGMNVNAAPEDFSPNVRETATSLKIECARDFEREEVLQRLIRMIDKHYQFLCENS